MILELSHITKSFGNKVVLKDVSFHLNDGSISILMGVNGSGKTTLFNIISGFLNPDSGEISLNKKEIKGIREYKINRRGVSRTFQDLRL
ncbi:MAG: ATP-binding cassette domain-containing protein, partial [Bacteroidales bacterium]